MWESLPRTAEKTLDWSWNQFEPYFRELADRRINAGATAEFLGDWTRLAELTDETYTRLHIAVTKDTSDQEAEQRYHAFLDDIYPRIEELEQTLKQKLLEVDALPEGFEVPARRMKAEAELFRAENLPLKTREQKLCTDYDKIVGARTVEWEGEEITVTRLRPVFLRPDREKRERAWRLGSRRQLEDRGAINDLWGRFLDVRLEIARNADYSDYRSYRWKELHRFDYSPEDCIRFHEAIEQTVLPAANRVAEERRRRLGVSSLRPWDMDVDPLGRPPLKPFDDVASLKGKCSTIFHRLDPELGEYFDIMAREDCLDLENRKNKAPGGYCTHLSAVKRPFIFMNAVGIHDDVQTLLHESGHAFHSFEASALPYHQQREVGMEFAEVASMAMELLAGRYLAESEGGFYADKEDAARARRERLEWALLFWPYMAVVDAFQHWAYENPDDARDPEKCDAKWASMQTRFMPWIDWSGLTEELRSGWHQKLHIHVVPFYYVEYGLAQLGATQIWGASLEDPVAAVEAYRAALALGGSAPLPVLYGAAGARFAFDTETLASAVRLIETNLASMSDEGAITA